MKTSILLLAGIAVACAAPVLAAPVSVRVSFAGLDLSSAEGRATLDHRITDAVTQVCGDTSVRELDRMIAVRQCRRDAFASARPQVEQAVAAKNKAVQVAIAR